MVTVEFNRLKIKPGFKILDIGCGSGRHTSEAYRLPNIFAVGADLKYDDLTQAAERLTWAQSQDIIRRMGFGRKTNIGLPGESGGIVTSAENWTKYSQTSTAIGQEVAVTPVQMVRAYCALAREGDLKGTLPELRPMPPTKP